MRARGFWGLFFVSQKISCATKTLLAHFLRDTSFLWHKYIFAVSSSSFKICLYFLMVCISILGGAALHVCVIMLLQDYSLVRLFSCTIVLLLGVLLSVTFSRFVLLQNCEIMLLHLFLK